MRSKQTGEKERIQQHWVHLLRDDTEIEKMFQTKMDPNDLIS